MPVRREVGAQVRIYSGQSGGATSPTLNHVPVTMLEVQLEPGASLRDRLPASDNAFVYILEGVVKIGDAATRVQANQLAWLTRSEEPGSSQLTLRAK